MTDIDWALYTCWLRVVSNVASIQSFILLWYLSMVSLSSGMCKCRALILFGYFLVCTVKSSHIHPLHPSIHLSTLRVVFISWIVCACCMFCFDSVHVMMVHDNLQSYYCVEGLVKREGLYVCQVTLQRYCSNTPESRMQPIFLEPSLPPTAIESPDTTDLFYN